ncbi:ribosome biogenesis protein [Grosmannia clavigera kw1407]|uniref:Ribosome biogenesis regulatory protein n=1 Tax=Grosmannia clavigera (strain kw1407 / UAMH 11150) TaxID=655863 RepID=F0XRC1_GROCL|nr:ribosome biogenesis protein [Grosmannia clavigera kw1407]EFW99821.1 ribosome biogenesis protein [Grosmannia clavigera kw1407]
MPGPIEEQASTAVAALAARPKLAVAVEKPTPYSFDLGLLLANDTNPVRIDRTASTATVEAQLAAVARDGAQALINQLLTTCRVERTASDGVLLSLPPVTTALPREKPLPQPKPPTRWEQFAARKGIKPKTREQRRNIQYDDKTQTWTPKWGFGGANKTKDGQADWLVEVKDWQKDADHAAKGTSVRGDSRRERKEHVRRNDRRMRRNELHAASAAGTRSKK